MDDFITSSHNERTENIHYCATESLYTILEEVPTHLLEWPEKEPEISGPIGVFALECV